MSIKKFKNKKILITGHSGFKGIWLCFYLINLGAKIFGISLKPNKYQKKILFSMNKDIKNYFFDITDAYKLNRVIFKIKPDFIFHLAAQPIVSESLSQPIYTWKTNVMGTGTLLNCLSKVKHKCTIIIVTSDKCYKIKDDKKIYYFKENDSLGGKDPYSASKAAEEIIFQSFYHSFFKNKKNINIASVRAGNVLGGGDWAENRIIPDCIKSWYNKKPVKIRNPYHVRPWQHVLDVINGYIILAQNLDKNKMYNGESFNFGPEKSSIKTVLNICKMLQVKWKDFNQIKILKTKKKMLETNILALSNKKSKKYLKWKPILNLQKVLDLTSEWYKRYDQKKQTKSIYLDQLNYYLKLCQKKR